MLYGSSKVTGIRAQNGSACVSAKSSVTFSKDTNRGFSQDTNRAFLFLNALAILLMMGALGVQLYPKWLESDLYINTPAKLLNIFATKFLICKNAAILWRTLEEVHRNIAGTKTVPWDTSRRTLPCSKKKFSNRPSNIELYFNDTHALETKLSMARL